VQELGSTLFWFILCRIYESDAMEENEIDFDELFLEFER
jgi:hypothetical protein